MERLRSNANNPRVTQRDHKKQEADEDFEAFINEYFEDLDLEYLFDDAYGGIDETELAQIMGISSLALDQWFTPFSDEPSRAPHPYVYEDHFPTS